MILVDYNGVAMGVITAMNLPPDEGLLRHTILNSLRSIYKKFKSQYGEMIICCDSSSWRGRVFKEYKYKRKADREKDSESHDYWQNIFFTLNQVREEIKTNLPWKVLHVHGAEGDDCIASMVFRTQEFGKHEDVMIVASDSDFKQLHSFKNVKQWSPQLQKMVKCESPSDWLHEAIVKGQAKDGIPNIKTNADFFVKKANGEASRQKTITKKFLKESMTLDNLSVEEIDRYKTNKTLIDFNQIPQNIIDLIQSEYEVQERVAITNTLSYFIAYNLKQLMENIEDFK